MVGNYIVGVCEICGEHVTPLDEEAKAHICKVCFEDTQIGDRVRND